jgi:hypothetical protein
LCPPDFLIFKKVVKLSFKLVSVRDLFSSGNSGLHIVDGLL